MKTDWLPWTPPLLGPSCERVSLRNDVLQLDYEIAPVSDHRRRYCFRGWILISARRLEEALRYGMPIQGEDEISIETANAQIRELLAEGRRMAGSMGAWVLVEGGR